MPKKLLSDEQKRNFVWPLAVSVCTTALGAVLAWALMPRDSVGLQLVDIPIAYEPLAPGALAIAPGAPQAAIQRGVGRVIVPTLDVKLKNNGDLPAFIKRLRLTVTEFKRFSPPACPGPPPPPLVVIPSSATYDLALPWPTSGGMDLRGQSAELDVSEEVPAKGIGRFGIRVGYEGLDQLATGHPRGLYRVTVAVLEGSSQTPDVLGTALLAVPVVYAPTLDPNPDTERAYPGRAACLRRIRDDLAAFFNRPGFKPTSITDALDG